MTALLDAAPPMSRSAYDRHLAKVIAFADRHPEIQHCIRQRVNGLLYVARPSRLDVGPFTGGRHETLVDLVVAARRDGIPVTVEIGAVHVEVTLYFGGLLLRAVDYPTTSADDSALESLASCTLAMLPTIQRRLAEIWEAGS